MRSSDTARKHTHCAPESGAGGLRVALLLPLLDTEALSIEAYHTWHTLFPDTEEEDA